MKQQIAVLRSANSVRHINILPRDPFLRMKTSQALAHLQQFYPLVSEDISTSSVFAAPFPSDGGSESFYTVEKLLKIKERGSDLFGEGQPDLHLRFKIDNRICSMIVSFEELTSERMIEQIAGHHEDMLVFDIGDLREGIIHLYGMFNLTKLGGLWACHMTEYCQISVMGQSYSQRWNYFASNKPGGNDVRDVLFNVDGQPQLMKVHPNVDFIIDQKTGAVWVYDFNSQDVAAKASVVGYVPPGFQDNNDDTLIINT